MPSCTSSREPAQQTWPWLNQIASTTPSTAPSRSASSNTMKGDLPPSSSVSDLPVPAVAWRIRRPTSVEPVKAILSTPGCSTSAAPVAPSPVTTLSTPGGRPASCSEFGEQQRGERGELGGLQHHRVAERERRRDLPGQHQQRKIPRNDLADDADRAVVGEFACPATAPSRRDDRNAAPPAARRDRGSRGCGLPLSRALQHGEQPGSGAAPCARAHRDVARGHGRRASPSAAAPCGRRRRRASTSAAEPCAIFASGLPVAGSRGVEMLAGLRRHEAAVDEMSENLAMAFQPGAGLGIGLGRRAVVHGVEIVGDAHFRTFIPPDGG